jgi:hypothetical protein
MGKQSQIIIFSGDQSGRPDLLGLCRRLSRRLLEFCTRVGFIGRKKHSGQESDARAVSLGLGFRVYGLGFRV